MVEDGAEGDGRRLDGREVYAKPGQYMAQFSILNSSPSFLEIDPAQKLLSLSSKLKARTSQLVAGPLAQLVADVGPSRLRPLARSNPKRR